jgi:hypothetical protein
LVKRNHRWRWWDVTLRPLAIFFLLYFYRGGFRDGFRGFFISAYRSIYSFMIYSRLYEIDVKRNIRH